MTDAFVNPIQSLKFNPDADCAKCKYPLPVDQVVSTVCKHIFHAKCLINGLNRNAVENRAHYDKEIVKLPQEQRAYRQELAKYQQALTDYNHAIRRGAKPESLQKPIKPEQPSAPVLCPCPNCRTELNGTVFTTLTSLPPDITQEARDCGFCLNLQDPSVVKTPFHQFHSLCFDQETDLAKTAGKPATCSEDGSELAIVDFYDGAQVRQNLKLPPLPSKPYVYYPGMDAPFTQTSASQARPNVDRVDSFGDVNRVDSFPHAFAPMNDDYDISNIVLGIIAVVILASIVSYAVNAIFFAGANPVLYVLGLPAGLILDPIIRGFVAV